jgi:hypothetical protein
MLEVSCKDKITAWGGGRDFKFQWMQADPCDNASMLMIKDTFCSTELIYN